MTLQDLYKSVSQLGFEDTLGEDGTSRFIYATNRALSEINALRPRRRSVTINHRVPTNLLFSQPTQIEKTGDLKFTAKKAKSFYFEVCGQGSYQVWLYKKVRSKDGDGKDVITTEDVSSSSAEVTFDTKTYTAIRGIIMYNGAFIDSLMKSDDIERFEKKEINEYYTGDVEIRFFGDFDYTIRNLALYDRVYSIDESDIAPYRNLVPYKITRYVNDFERFDSSPINLESGNYLNTEYSIEDRETILLPLERQGAYTINYIHAVEKMPNNAEPTNEGATSRLKLDLDDDLVELMPNLVAAYVWLDDESEKAQYYLNLYMQRAAQIQKEAKDVTPIIFQSVYGW